MIKQVDLRRENLFIFKPLMKPMQFGGWPHKKMYDFDAYKPIPLTHEILKALGFNLTMENMVYDLPGCWEYKCVKINYLHQLQNLYFAFNGEELTVNLLVKDTVSKS